MPASEYILALREKIGHDLLLTSGVVALIRDEEGRVLLQRRSDDGSWSLPAGGVDPGESPAQALVREVYEESGLKVVPVAVAGVFGGGAFFHVYPNGDQVYYYSIAFLCRVVGGRLEPRDGESLELRYVLPDELPASKLLERFPKALFGFKQGDAPIFRWDDAWLDGLT